MKNPIIIIISLVIILLAAAIFIYGPKFINLHNAGQPNQPTVNLPQNTTPETSPVSNNPSLFTPPISKATERVTKKPFGIKITPEDSPVQLEKFSGYHTGVDFEILPGEEEAAVPIFSVCSGLIIEKGQVNDYGGVIVELCQLDNQDITIVYGHLKLASITIKTGKKISAGQQIGILGKGYSSETSNERKHLHLGMHQGNKVDLRGYIDKPSDLNNWIDILKYLK